MGFVGTATVKLQDSPHYRRDAFHAGFLALDYRIAQTPLMNPGPRDVLVLWNRYARDEAHARRYEKAGAHVLITENAWIGPEDKADHWFALCRNYHNGAGSWAMGNYPRNKITPAPWRTRGDYIYVLPQRGMGSEGVRQPKGWLESIVARLANDTARPIRIHHHPGIRPHPPFILEDAWASVIWGSGAGIKSIIAGVPVFYEMPNWIGGPAARPYSAKNLEHPFIGNREFMLNRLAWAMWTADEIATGEPFRWLL
jgi:hypothetical protein